MGAFLPLLGDRPRRILDAGAGTGKFSCRLLELGHEVVILEPSAQMLAVARQKVAEKCLSARASFVSASIVSIPLPDASVDAVFCEGDPLSYCRSTFREAARELVRVLRPGGALYVSCDNRYLAVLAHLFARRPEEALATLASGASADPYGIPVHAFMPAELEEVLRAAGAVGVSVRAKLSLSLFVSESLLADPAFAARLLDAERGLSARADAAALGGHLYATARRPGGAA